MKDPPAEAEAYLERHDVKRLFRDLGTRLLFERPLNANECLLSALEDIQRSNKSDEPSSKQPFFTEKDVKACFRAYDIHGRGILTAEQQDSAFRSLGLEDFEAATGTVDREKFISKALEELQKDATRKY